MLDISTVVVDDGVFVKGVDSAWNIITSKSLFPVDAYLKNNVPFFF